LLLPEPAADGLIYLTSAQAGELMGVSPAAVLRWERVGYLPAAGKGERGRRLYEYGAVITAEFQAREAAIRTSGTDAQVRRHFAA
jgi:hypothetical protein